MDPGLPLKLLTGRSGECLINALERHEIDYRFLHRNEITAPEYSNLAFITFAINGTKYCSNGTAFFRTDGTTYPGASVDGMMGRLLKSKPLTNAVLRHHGFSVPEGVAVANDEALRARIFFETMGPFWNLGACLKPADGRLGQDVYVGIRETHAFQQAFDAIAKRNKLMLLEESVAGSVYRFFCIAGRVVAIRIGEPPSVIGDGVSTIAHIFAINGRSRTKLADNEVHFIAQQGLSPESIPQKGELVRISAASNVAQGAVSVDVTDDVDAYYIELVERATLCFPGLTICGVDVAMTDSARASSYHFIEINTAPWTEGHHFPSKGKPRDVAGAILKHLASLD